MLRNAALTIGVLFALAALLFVPPVDRALGGLFALSADGAIVAYYPDWLRQQSTRHHWGYVDYSSIPKCLEHAIISVEDKRFMLHGGVDPMALSRASVEYAENDHEDHGGSTITLQLARIMLHVPRRQPSLLAEVQSQLRVLRAALIVEHDYSKQKILELYLNGVYFGRRAIGAEAAALAYFNMGLQQLNEAQCIYLAGLPNAPARFGADPSGQQAITRFRHVIATMERNGYLTKEQALALNGTQLFPHLSEK